MSRQTITVDTY